MEISREKTRQMEGTDRRSSIPLLPAWPTSLPGPMITDLLPGHKRVRSRPEQMMVVGYETVQGKSTERGL